MSLNWSVKNIANADSVCWVGKPGEETLNPVTEALIWRTMGIDIGRFTAKNIDEVAFRLRVYSRLFGKPLTKVVKDADGRDDLEYFDFTIEQIKAHIGLSTNVGDASRSAFLKNTIKRLEREILESVAWELKKAKQTAEQKEVK